MNKINAMLHPAGGDTVKSSFLYDTLDSANFEELFKLYFLKGKPHFAAKADVINFAGFLNYLQTRPEIPQQVMADVEANLDPQFKSMVNKGGFFVVFWDKPAEIYHRDLMRYTFWQISNSAKTLEDRAIQAGVDLPRWTPGYKKKFEFIDARASDLTKVRTTIEKAVSELSIGKHERSAALSPIAQKMYGLSQGFQLYSEKPSERTNLWRRKIYEIAMESAITTDQNRYEIQLPSDVTSASIEQILKAIRVVNFATTNFQVPESHKVNQTHYDTNTYHINHPGEIPQPRKHSLRVHYHIVKETIPSSL
jgi:hypothetical protein